MEKVIPKVGGIYLEEQLSGSYYIVYLHTENEEEFYIELDSLTQVDMGHTDSDTGNTPVEGAKYYIPSTEQIENFLYELRTNYPKLQIAYKEEKSFKWF